MLIPSEVRKLYEDDEWSLRQIARHFNSNTTTVSNVLDLLGVRRRPTGWSRNHVGNPNVGWPNKRRQYARSNSL